MLLNPLIHIQKYHCLIALLAIGCLGCEPTQQEAEARLDHDLVYLQRFSIGFDLKIMARTVFHVLAALRQWPN